MRWWTGWFETDDGHAEFVEVEAATLGEAREILARRYPDDVGADGEIESGDGEWYSPWPEQVAA